MKKLIVMLMLTLFSIGAYAQTQQGQSSFGFNLGYNFGDYIQLYTIYIKQKPDND